LFFYIESNTTTENNTNSNNPSNLVNIDDYQSAQKLSEIAYRIFKYQLEPLSSSSPNNDIDNHTNDAIISKIDKSLIDLKNSVSNKVSAQELMAIVHMQIHPSLQLVYNLQLIQQ